MIKEDFQPGVSSTLANKKSQVLKVKLGTEFQAVALKIVEICITCQHFINICINNQDAQNYDDTTGRG